MNAETLYQDLVLGAPAAAKAGEPGWLAPFREKAKERFQKTGFPTRRMEAWKYMSLEPVLKMPVRRSAAAVSEPVKTDSDFEDFFFFWNGVYMPGLSSYRQLPSGVKAGLLSSGRFENLGLEAQFVSALEKEDNPFAVINAFHFDDAFVLWVPQGTVIPEPVHFCFSGREYSASYPRIVLMLEAGAKAEVIFDFCGKAPHSLTDAQLDVRLAPNANLQAVQVQRSEGSFHFFNARVRQAEGSALNWVSFSSEVKAARNEVFVNFEGENAFASLSGLALLDGDSQVFQHAFVHHEKPNGTSRQVYKNILSGKSIAEFDSLVHVWRGAKQSDSQQIDRNLLLSDHARAFSRPQLKIDDDDVKASHGAATGQLEKNELFYLRSRGLSKEAARYLITYGFAEEVLELIGHASLRKELEEFTAARIRRMTAAH